MSSLEQVTLMIADLPFPANGALANWARQLVPWQPRALWVGHLFVQQIETFVETIALKPLERLPALVLSALALEAAPTPREVMRRLCHRMHMPEAILRQAVAMLAMRGLVAQDSLALTDAGKQALPDGQCRQQAWERRSFAFCERWDESGQRVSPPQFLPVTRISDEDPWPAPSPWDERRLRECVSQMDSWKETCGFPYDVVGLGDRAPADIPCWQRVTVVRPARMQVVLVLGRQGTSMRLLGFTARGDSLHASTPFLAVSEEMQKVAPELTPQPPAEAIAHTWQNWCRHQGVLTPLVETCPCQIDGLALRVQAPPLLMHELRIKRCGVDGQEWLLCGAGPMRRALQLHVNVA